MIIPHVRGGQGDSTLKPQGSNEIMQGRQRLERMRTRQGCKMEGGRIGGRFRDGARAKRWRMRRDCGLRARPGLSVYDGA